MGYRCMFMMWAINPGVKGLRKEFLSVNSLSDIVSGKDCILWLYSLRCIYILSTLAISISLELARLSRRALLHKEVAERALQPLMI